MQCLSVDCPTCSPPSIHRVPPRLHPMHSLFHSIYNPQCSVIISQCLVYADMDEYDYLPDDVEDGFDVIDKGDVYDVSGKGYIQNEGITECIAHSKGSVIRRTIIGW